MAPTDRAKNTLRGARLIRNLSNTPQGFTDRVGRTDPDDLYRVQTANRSTLSFSVNGITRQSRIAIQVFSLKGARNRVLKAIGGTAFSELSAKQTKQRIKFLAKRGSSKTRTLNLSVDPGSYYVRVLRGQGNNRYRLRLSATPITPDSPLAPIPNPPSPNPVPTPLAFADPAWLRQFGGSDNDYAFSTAVDSAGDIYVAGVQSTSNAFLGRGFVAKYKQDGSLEWQRSLSLSGSTAISDIAVDVAGNYYVTGALVNGFNSDGFIVKYNSAGTQEWIQEVESTSLGVDAVSSIVIDPTNDSNDIYITGIRRGAPAFLGASQGKAFVAKYTSGGSLVTGFGTNGFTEFGDARTTAGAGIALGNGSLYITGITNANLSTDGSNIDLTDGDAFVASFNQFTGSLLWSDTLGVAGTDYGRSIALNGSELYIGGQTAGTLPSGSLPANSFAGGEADAFFAKYTVTNTSGTRQWAKQFGGTDLDAIQAVTIDPAGRIYLTGETNTGLFGNRVGGSDAWLAEIDSNGNFVRSTQIGTPQDDEAYTLITGGNGTLYVAGQTQGTFAASPTQNQGNYDVWLSRYNPA